MTAGSILLGMALFIIVILFVARPLLTAKPAESPRANERRRLIQQKEAILDEIQELDFDHETGKVPTDVYEGQRAYLMTQAAAVLQALDEIAEETNEDMRRQIETAIKRRRHQVTPAAASNGRGSFCTHCGRHLEQEDKFCAGCGRPARVVQPSIS